MASSIVSTADPESSPLLPVISHEDLLFDYPDADVILRSLDSHDFRVLKMYIVHSSPVLREKISISPTPQPEPTPPIPAEPAVEGAAAAANTLCVVQLPVEGAILFSLLTHIFPVPPVLPSTVEQVMELLSVAQQYKMDVVLTHIRNHIARREPPLIRRETSPVVYFLSLKYGLHPEALQAARCTLSLGTLTFGGLAKGDVLDKMPGAFLHELWKYHLRVRSNLSLDLKEFEMSGVPTILGESSCVSLTDSSIPSWLKNYLSTIGTGRRPATIDLADFHMSLAKHTRTVNSQAVKRGSMGGCASCSGLRRKSIRELWEALTAVVRGSISKTELDFTFPIEGTCSEGPTREAASPPKYSNMFHADVILQSSDHVNFRVHKSVLATSSPFFRDMFTLPQPPNGTASDELPVVHVSEDAVILDSLISMLYPVIPPKMPDSGDDLLVLLAATAKYDMDAIRSSIREEISRKGLFESTRARVFRVYAIAYRKNLLPEMAITARLTLGHPLTFESLGDTLQLFEGCALRDLVDFRLDSIRKFSALLFDTGLSDIWAGCQIIHGEPGEDGRNWFEDFRSQLMETDKFTGAIPTSQKLYDEYLGALQSHIQARNCQYCMNKHVMQGESVRVKLKNISTQAWNSPTIRCRD